MAFHSHESHPCFLDGSELVLEAIHAFLANAEPEPSHSQANDMARGCRRNCEGVRSFVDKIKKK